MTEARQRDAWDHTAQLCAAVYNSQKTKDPVDPSRFHPFRQGTSAEARRKQIIPNNPITILKILIPPAR